MIKKYELEDGQTVWNILSIWVNSIKISLVTMKVEKGFDNSFWVFPGIYYSSTENTGSKRVKQIITVGARFLRYGVGVLVSVTSPEHYNETEN